MTITRQRFVIGVVIVTLAAVLAFTWVGWREVTTPEPVRAYERLRLGMTKDEVINAIGVPPGNYTNNESGRTYFERIRESGMPFEKLRSASVTVELWMWKDHSISVAFDEAEKTAGFYLFWMTDYSQPYQPSFIDRVREFLGL